MVTERIPLRGQMWISRVSIIRRSFQCGLEVREVGLVDVIWLWNGWMTSRGPDVWYGESSERRRCCHIVPR